MIEIWKQGFAAFPWVAPLMVILVGACIGSFLNVCIYRIPKGESVVYPPSHSASGRALSWWENVPVLSWFYLGGRDRETGERFSFRYPFVEMLTAGVFFCIWQGYVPVAALVMMYFAALLIVGAFIDYDHMVIPDSVTVVGMTAGVALSMLVPEIQDIAISPDVVSPQLSAGCLAVVGALVGSGMLFWVRELSELLLKRPCVGEGDLKLIGCIGAFCGWQGAVFSFFAASAVGIMVMVPVMGYGAFRKRAGARKRPAAPSPGEADCGVTESPRESLWAKEVPFGPFLTIGALAYVLGLHQAVDRFFGLADQVFFGPLF
ncbi:MAG: prepilin peptidase [Opitutales bacterium]|nr:prepilin peptidase [Opitutales bacterium]